MVRTGISGGVYFPLEMGSEGRCLGTGGGPRHDWRQEDGHGHGLTLQSILGL